MNWQQIQGSWTELKGTVRERWGRLTGSDNAVIAGRREQLIGTIQKRYGLIREDVERQVERFSRRASAPR